VKALARQATKDERKKKALEMRRLRNEMKELVDMNLNRFRDYYKNKTCLNGQSCNFYTELSAKHLRREYYSTGLELLEFKVNKQ